MRIYLAGIGWLPDAPKGNRLRWSFPSGEIKSRGRFIGFPETVVVERAPVDEDIPQVKPTPTAILGLPAAVPVTATAPFSWWDNHGTVNLAGFPPLRHQLPSPIQAVSFQYMGPAARMLVMDRENDRLVADRMVSNGDAVYLESPAMDEFIFLAFAASLNNFRTLDLFKNRGLTWETIAEIRVAATGDFPYDEVAVRYDMPPTLSPDEWKELVELAKLAQESKPSTLVEGDPTPWESFFMALGIRWELALLYGHGFFDGPRTNLSPLDEIDESKLLPNVPPQAMAYRVRDRDKRVPNSNIVVCPPWLAAPLLQPSLPQFVDPEVGLTDEGKFEATLGMRWQLFDARAIGVEVEEEIGPSPSLGTQAQTNAFENRSRRPEVPPLHGETARVFDVPFHDVRLKARARATDGWDRVSVFSAWTPPTPLNLIHEPPPPPLASVRYNGGSVRIVRQVGDPDLPDWQPDRVTEQAAGKVSIYRQSVQPRVENVTAGAPVHAEGRLYKTVIPGVVGGSDFSQGYLIAGRVKASVADISGSEFFFEAPDEGGGSVTLFDAGPAKLQQNPLDESLWVKVAEFPAVGLPEELVFSDPVAGPTGKADVLSYTARISYLGRLGPASNVAQAVRIPATPAVPPPFTVEILGIDFYDRTMVKIRMTNPVSSGKYSVWWADGSLTSSQFNSQAVPGEYGVQTAENGLFLYDVFSLPVPKNVNRTVTIGVQQVNEAEGQSNFSTVQMVLNAMGP
jgi:hypothetical protein